VRSRHNVLAGMVACLLTMGCVTTTTITGGVHPDADRGDAARLNYELGARYYRNGNYTLARDRLTHSIELEPRNAVAHSTLALTYEKLGNLRLATDAYERAIKIAPKDYKVQNTYAVFLCGQREFDKARKHFDRSVKRFDNDYAEITLTNAGVCMVQKPDFAQAEAYFRQALEQKSNYGEALIQMALLKHHTGDNLIASAFLRRFLNSNLPSPEILFLGVKIEDGLSDTRARTEYINRLLREYPTSAEAQRALALERG